MPSTIKDDESAIVPAAKVELQKHKVRFKSSAEFTATKRQPKASAHTIKEGFLRKLGIGGIAILVSIGLAGRVNAIYVTSDCAYPAYVKCWDASQISDLDAYRDGICIGGAKRFITGWHGDWYSHFNTGDYIDERWYYYLDEGQYYYLDRAQYKLLGGASYLLGHPCYPKLYERRSGQGVGFTNRGGKHWFDAFLTFQFISNPVQLSNKIGSPFDNVYIGYGGPLPISRYVIWNCCFSPGDNIDVWKYYYLDKGRYHILDETQYKWLGGMAYLFESTHYRSWYAYGFPYDYGILSSMEENLKADIPCYKIEPSIPEPATIGFLALGALGLLILRNKRKAEKV